jgi:hypothetical protein
MKRYKVMLGGNAQRIEADQFKQDGEFVAFYIKGAVIALVRFGYSDSIVEEMKGAG